MDWLNKNQNKKKATPVTFFLFLHYKVNRWISLSRFSMVLDKFSVFSDIVSMVAACSSVAAESSSVEAAASSVIEEILSTLATTIFLLLSTVLNLPSKLSIATMVADIAWEICPKASLDKSKD